MNKRVVPSSCARPFRFQESNSAPLRAGNKARYSTSEGEEAAREMLREVEETAFCKGLEAGIEKARNEARQELEAALQRVSKTLGELNHLKARILQSCEKEVVALAIEIARKLVQRELSLDGKITAALVRVALEKLNRNGSIRIFVSPEDLEILEEELKDAPASGMKGELVLKGRPDLKRGDCVIESECGTIEGQMEARIREIEEGLLAGF